MLMITVVNGKNGNSMTGINANVQMLQMLQKNTNVKLNSMYIT